MNNSNGSLRAPDPDYTVVVQIPDAMHYIHDPGLVLLPSGNFLAATPRRGRRGATHLPLVLSLSEDGGKTWRNLGELPYVDATPFLHYGRLYMFVQFVQSEGVWFVASDDEGTTWSEPVEVLKGNYWNCQTAMVIRDGKLYWPVSEGFQNMAVISCDLAQGILNPAAWRASAYVVMPLPPELIAGTFTDGGNMRCLEGNMIEIDGRLRVLARACINGYGTANLAAVFDLKDEKGKLDLSFTQFYPLPGGQCKFCIVRDEPSQLFWMASNLPSNSQDLLGVNAKLGRPYEKDWKSLREDRRFLTLWYSLDALNWFPAGWIAKAAKLTQSFMYPSMVIDGDDLAILSRTSRDSDNYHDADLSTFHRVRNFRALAMDIAPRI